MVEYLGAVVVMSAILGVISYVSYPSGSDKAVKFAASVLLVFTAVNPIIGVASGLGDLDINGFLENSGGEDIKDGVEYEEVAQQAFTEGISKVLFTKYGIDSSDAEIFVFGFDFRSMKAEKIKILLSGKGSFKDFRAIEEYITGAGLGECEVNVKIG